MTVSPHQLNLLTRQLNQAHRAAMQAELSAAGLSEVGHPMLLTILQHSGQTREDHPSLAQRDFADLLHISPAAVANSLKSLEKGDYIRREPGQGDARRNHVMLTQKGEEAVTGCRRALMRVCQQMLFGISPEEQEQLMSLCQRILCNLQDESTCPPQTKEDL